MSVTITQHPSSISFAGNPVLLKVRSNLANKTFLKICAEVNVSAYRRAEHLFAFSETLSVPTEGNDKVVNFDLSDLLLSALSRLSVERCGALAEGGIPTATGGYVQYSVEVWDEYLDEYQEIVSSKSASVSSPSSGLNKALPGAYTDMQRLTLPEDTASFLGSAHILSNKPDYEPIPDGGKVTVPVFSTEYRTVDVYMDSSSNNVGTHSVYATEVSWKSLTVQGAGARSLVWSGLNVPPVFIYVVPQPPFARYFEFVNRLGAVESIYTFGRAKRKTSPSQERQVKRHNNSFKPTTRYVKRTLQEEQTWELSTGPVNREWAKWFSAEFFTAEQAWMYSDAAGDMVPVIVESDEDISIYDESAAEVLDLQFKVTMCIND